MNRRMPNGTYGGVRGWGRETPAYSIAHYRSDLYFLPTGSVSSNYEGASAGLNFP